MKEWKMFNKIKELKDEGLKKIQVARRLNADPRTIKKYWDMDYETFESLRFTFKQRITGKKLDTYKQIILDWITEHKDLSGAQVYDWLKEQYEDFSLAERTVRDYVGVLRRENNIPKLTNPRQYTMIPETPMGEQAQVDMGQITLKNKAGGRKKIYVFTMVLAHSRYKYSQWQSSPFTTKDMISLHNKAFVYFGGITKTIVYDQDRTMFVKENEGDIVMTDSFQQYQRKLGFKIHLCRAYDPESKGKVESVVKYVKNNFAKNRLFETIQEFNALNDAWLERRGNSKEHSTTKKVPAEVFIHEKEHLMPIPHSLVETEELTNIVTYSIGKDNSVSYKSNRYQLPKGTYSNKNKEVNVEVINEEIYFYSIKTNEIIISYPVSKDRGVIVAYENRGNRVKEELLSLEKEILEFFKNKENITSLVELIKIEKPRYLKEQLKKLKRILLENSIIAVEKALDEVMIKGSSNLVELETLVLSNVLKLKEGDKSAKSDSGEIKLPEALQDKIPELRDASEYAKKLGGTV